MTNIITQRFTQCLQELRERKLVKSSRQFALELDYLPQSLSEILNGRRDVTVDLLRKAVEAFHFNPYFLFTGEGDPLSVSVNESKRLVVVKSLEEKEQIVFVPGAAQYTYARSTDDAAFIEKLPTFTLPEPKYAASVHRSFEISGDTMEPTVFEGDKVVASFLEPDRWLSGLKNNYVYVIVVKNEVFVRRVVNHIREKGMLQLLSDNYFFNPFDVSVKDVLEIWYVRARISPFLPSPNRIQEMFLEEIKTLKTKVVEQTLMIGQLSANMDRFMSR